MGACSFTLTGYYRETNGHARVIGKASMSSSYSIGGDTLDLSTYLSGSPHVLVTQLSHASFFPLHDQGTASGGKVLVYQITQSASEPYDVNITQVTGGTGLSTVSFNIVAVGIPT